MKKKAFMEPSLKVIEIRNTSLILSSTGGSGSSDSGDDSGDNVRTSGLDGDNLGIAGDKSSLWYQAW